MNQENLEKYYVHTHTQIEQREYLHSVGEIRNGWVDLPPVMLQYCNLWKGQKTELCFLRSCSSTATCGSAREPNFVSSIHALQLQYCNLWKRQRTGPRFLRSCSSTATCGSTKGRTSFILYRQKGNTLEVAGQACIISGLVGQACIIYQIHMHLRCNQLQLLIPYYSSNKKEKVTKCWATPSDATMIVTCLHRIHPSTSK